MYTRALYNVCLTVSIVFQHCLPTATGLFSLSVRPLGDPMPKHRDAELEGHILNAAYELIAEGGEQALTMRAVARAAGTTTPTVYQRFRDKRTLAELVRRRAVENLVAAITPGGSPGETC